MTEHFLLCQSCLHEKAQSDFRRQRRPRRDGAYGFARCCRRCEAGLTELHEVRRLGTGRAEDLKLPDLFWSPPHH